MIASIGLSPQPTWAYGPNIRDILRKFSASIGLGFLLLLIAMVLINSSKRSSVLGSETSSSMSEEYFTGMSQPGSDSSRLRLQDFHRVAIKDGRTIWEVRASDAQYYSAEGISHLNKASLTLYQKDNSTIALKADAAKLHMSDSGLSRAELLGNVVVNWANAMQIHTESALYELDSSQISAPEWVKIDGDGYIVEGEGLYAQIDAQRVTLARNVRSVFTESKSNSGGRVSAVGAKALLDQMEVKRQDIKE